MTVHPYCVDPSHWHVYPVPDFICTPGSVSVSRDQSDTHEAVATLRKRAEALDRRGSQFWNVLTRNTVPFEIARILRNIAAEMERP